MDADSDRGCWLGQRMLARTEEAGSDRGCFFGQSFLSGTEDASLLPGMIWIPRFVARLRAGRAEKWEERLSKDGEELMAAARALDEKIKVEYETHMRMEKEIESVDVRPPLRPLHSRSRSYHRPQTDPFSPSKPPIRFQSTYVYLR